MKVVFRADASLQMGTGHVMRCLTLADALTVRGAKCVFICRAHPGNLLELIRSKGHAAHALPALSTPEGTSLLAIKADDDTTLPAHSHWLGATQDEDAAACTPLLAELQPDWLIVDHYALDTRWEQILNPHYKKLMVIDDLADRSHVCNVLLDQTFGRQPEDYSAWVPANCQLLCGSQYALLRPEFAALRPYSLQRRTEPDLRHLLITMGGVDKDNATGQVLKALCASQLPKDCQITVVMGSTAPWRAEVERLVQDMAWPARVLVGVSDMAKLMADSDLAIGAAGATSWERCCLGLPTVMIVMAANQRHAASLLEEAQAALSVDLAVFQSFFHAMLHEVLSDITVLKKLSEHSRSVVDGNGCERVVQMLLEKAI